MLPITSNHAEEALLDPSLINVKFVLFLENKGINLFSFNKIICEGTSVISESGLKKLRYPHKIDDNSINLLYRIQKDERYQVFILTFTLEQ